MNPDTPPPLPKTVGVPTSRRSKVIIGLALVPVCLYGALIVLRICGMVRPFSIPTDAMTPAVSAGDHIVMEGVTFVARQPRRGDIVVFRTDGVASLPPATLYIKRVAGEPGDHLRISEGKLFVNDQQVSLSNSLGQIVYSLPSRAEFLPPRLDLTVPQGCYFLVGDNSTNSLDSRYYGSIPRGNILGRVSFCFWPPQRVGAVK